MLETYMEERLFKTSVATPFSSCSNMNTWNSLHLDHHFHHLSPSLSSEDGVSISNSLVTNASQSPHELNIGPASSAASTNFLGEGPSENHPWSQVLQYMETDLSALSSKHHPSEMIETPSNYLDKVDRSWDFTCLPSNYCNKTEKKLSNYYDMSSIKHGIVANSAEVVNNWPINPSLDPDVGHQLAPVTSNENQNLMQCYELGLLNKHQYVMPEMPRSLTRHTDYLNKPFTEVQTSNMINLNLRSPLFLDTRQDISSARGNSRGPGPANNHNGKKKKSEDTSDAHSKKPKQEFPKALSNKVNVPKAKLGDRISALQQIVSPFGKTDTASVLFEAIGYIKFLQEQVQLLTSPYLKSNDHNSRGDLELKSRGLCLAPISCTPQIFREYNGPDYLTPSHSGCLYR